VIGFTVCTDLEDTMSRLLIPAFLCVLLAISSPCLAAKDSADKTSDEEDDRLLSADTLAGLELRGLGPAINSGRVTDFAVTPERRHRYFVAVASGGVWRTDNAGTTWTPVFDEQGSYSIGCLAMDPSNPNVVWVGTGENNSQRSVSFGDGVYRTRDGGKSWENLGLQESEHIGRIAIDPRDPEVVYVAAQGPLWRSGGDRGLYKTTDGGRSWNRILHISDDTGVNEVHLDPRNPDVVYATAYQRGRRVWTLINGGPESGIHKSTDGGETWRQLTEGLPEEVDLGRIGLAISPVNPDVIYAIVEAQREEGGVFRSTNRGESWEKRSDYMSQSPQYYNELVAHPTDVDTVYSMDTWMHVSTDGGKTFTKVGEEHKHVDNHAMWIDPEDTDYFLVGCDGGVYESFDRGTTWRFRPNLPITQFYRVTVDNSTPFYFIYGGTQDNNTLGGPIRTLNRSGIANEDWFITVGGDGYETKVDPTNPDIVYSQWQYGGLVRYDRASGETIDIQPQEEPDEPAHRWNWDSPLIISPHSPTRLYYACQRVYRSDDRGDTWTAISGDLSRQLDRNKLPIMGRIWEMDAVAKNLSTSDYGNIVSLSESPLVEGLLYVGTDDGLIQVTEDGGESWRRIDGVKGIPEQSYVSRLEASLHDPDTVYAAFDNHKMGDFTPYVMVSRDRGRAWSSIAGDLPEREVVYALMQDHVDPDLLFAGTEFGLYTTVDHGKQWVRLKGGLPTIQVRDIDIQRRENDLALGTFGRGFYVLDDYTPLRHVSEETLGNDWILFPVRDALLYVEKRSRHGSRGHGFYTAANPPFGATFTYYLKEKLATLEEKRIEAEKKSREEEADPPLPSMAELLAEHEEVEPRIVLTVRDSEGEVVRRIAADREKGIHRASWDLRLPPATPTDLEEEKDLAPWEDPPRGPLVSPGSYTVTLDSDVRGNLTTLAGPETFEVVPLNLATLPAADREAAIAFQKKVQRLRRAVSGALKAAGEAEARSAHLRKAILDTPGADPELLAELQRLQDELNEILLALRGDPAKEKRNVFQPPAISGRVDRIANSLWTATSAPTATQKKAYRWAGEAFTAELARLRKMFDDLKALEDRLEDAGGPWTPGRLPRWTME
jgi:photosystem II stability/assembly factor-like uncharacterized protein